MARQAQAQPNKRISEIEAQLPSLAAAVNTVGQPTKYTAARVLSILDLLEEGNTLKVAALLSGISRETLNEWRKQYSDFSDMVDNAMALAERFYAQQLRGASKTDWNAAKFWLTHRHGDDWKPPATKTQIGGDPDNPAAIVVERVVFKGE